MGTARGVLHGIRAGVEHVFGSPALDGRRVLVQGVGAVGRELARLLAGDGAHVLVADVDADRAERVAAETGATTVQAQDALSTECDVYAPCAVGGTLDARSIPRLRCRLVAGSANNQLGAADDARRLHEAGIVYAPDFVVNVGGVLQLLGLEEFGWDEAELERSLAGDRRHAPHPLHRGGAAGHLACGRSGEPRGDPARGGGSDLIQSRAATKAHLRSSSTPGSRRRISTGSSESGSGRRSQGRSRSSIPCSAGWSARRRGSAHRSGAQRVVQERDEAIA